MSITQDSLSSLAAQLTDSQDRETYAALIAYFRSLPPNDELFHLAQLLGFLSLLGQRLPQALGDFLIELRAERKSTNEYYALVQERLVRLPQEIVAGVDWTALSQALGESFRQQITTSGARQHSDALAVFHSGDQHLRWRDGSGSQIPGSTAQRCHDKHSHGTGKADGGFASIARPQREAHAARALEFLGMAGAFGSAVASGRSSLWGRHRKTLQRRGARPL